MKRWIFAFKCARMLFRSIRYEQQFDSSDLVSWRNGLEGCRQDFIKAYDQFIKERLT